MLHESRSRRCPYPPCSNGRWESEKMRKVRTRVRVLRMYWTARMVRWGGSVRQQARQLALVSPLPGTEAFLAWKYRASSKRWTKRPLRIPASDIRSDTIPLEKRYKDALPTAPVTATWFWDRRPK